MIENEDGYDVDDYEPSCWDCHDVGCPSCGYFSPGLRGRWQMAWLWIRHGWYAAISAPRRWRARLRRRKPTDFTEPPF